MLPINELQSEKSTHHLLVIDTHPIQYRSPIFRKLAEKLSFEVIFLNENFYADKWWFDERNRSPKQTWNLPLKTGFPSTVLETRNLTLIQKVFLLRKVIRKKKPNALLTYGYYLPEHWIILILAKMEKIPLIFIGETFSNERKGIRKILRSVLRTFYFRNVAQFISIGKNNTSYYRNLGVPEKQIEETRYCVDNSFFHLSDEQALEERKKWRGQWQIPIDAFVTLFVGRLFYRKRPEDLIDVHTRFADQTRYHTVFVGNGELEDSLRNKTRSLKNLHWLGFQDQMATRNAYYGADVLVVPSEFETWGLVVNEAFTCGRPSIVTDTCGVANDLVMEGKTGFVVQVGDTQAIFEKLSLLNNNPGLLSQMGIQAQLHVQKNFTTSNFANSIIKACEKIDS